MTRPLETRLRRLERARVPAEPMHALILQARSGEDIALRVTAAVEAGAYRPNWPLLIVRFEPHPASPRSFER